MTKGVKPYHNRTNKGLLVLFLSRRLTIESMAKVLRVSIVTAQKYIDNPTLMRLSDFYLLAGYLDTPVVQLFAKVHYNTKELTPEQNKSLEDIIDKVSEGNNGG